MRVVLETPWIAAVLTVIAAIAACRLDDSSQTPPPERPRARTHPSAEPADPPAALDSDQPPLSRDEIRLVIRSKMKVIRGCFDAGLDRDPSIGGRVVLGFDILPSGRADAIELAVDEVGAGVGPCLVEALSSWQFPRPRGGRSMSITYPFVFNSERSLRAAGLPRVEGTVKPRAVGAVFEAHRAELDECVPDQAKGHIELALTIDDGGAVTRASVLDTSLEAAVSACVTRTVSSWRFPPTAEGDEARVNHALWW